MNQSDIARALGVSRSTISKCKAMGMPVDSVDAAADWRERCLDPNWSVPPPSKLPSTGARLTAERARVAKAQADRLELLNARARGELLERRAVEAVWGKRISTFRTRILAIPSRVSVFAPLGAYAKVYDALEREIHLALRELGGGDADL